MSTPFENEVSNRFGVLPNFFLLATTDPKIAENLWGFAQFAYLDNALPSLFKERLVRIPVPILRDPLLHRPARWFSGRIGIPGGRFLLSRPQTVESTLPLLRRPLPRGEDLFPLFTICAAFENPLSSFPEPESSGEQAIFACATHVFLQTPDAPAHARL